MVDFKTFIGLLRRAALEALYPAFCMGCGAEGCFLCGDCLARETYCGDQVCPACCKITTGGYLCDKCTGALDLDRLVAVSAYKENSLLAKTIHSLKYEFVEELAEALAKPVAGILEEPAWRDYAVCPVPLHPKRQKWRGFNQSELLAVRAAGFCGLTVHNILERTSFSRPQMELKKEQRLLNVAGAFRCVRRPPPKTVLIDDVATTLATLNACAKALKEAGAVKVSAIVLARVA